MADWQVRVAEEADLPAAAAAWRRLQEFHHGLGLAFDLPADAADKWLASFQRSLGRFSFLWVAGPSGQPLAFLLARLKQSAPFLGGVQVGEISDLFVDDSQRGSGLGAQLTQVALDKFRELGVHSVEVQVQAGNQGGLDFWHKQGFAADLTLVRKVL